MRMELSNIPVEQYESENYCRIVSCSILEQYNKARLDLTLTAYEV